MWYLLVTAASFLFGIYSFRRTRNKQTIVSEINRARTINDVLRLVRRLARRSPTEEVAERLADALGRSDVKESTIKRLSQLNKKHGQRMDAKGFAICVVWSSVVATNQERIRQYA